MVHLVGEGSGSGAANIRFKKSVSEPKEKPNKIIIVDRVLEF